nr:coiled-coil domain-containing glutamate-rich protein 1 isoform X1 [Pelodiscus sinensis]XP_025044435.1 coiled-coil domain-containing glutamate-rich protein 1 isoform X2 [Pelodiscus sinensis]|eukprot:XP_025044434.1 coiled-coil domain-containing glutamate-rich protein 1 isoform X1 [Pelodiscus sinensis]
MLRAAIGVGNGPKAGGAGRNSSRQGQQLQETSWLRPGGAGSSRRNQQYRGNWQLQEEMEPRKQLVVQNKKYLVEQNPYIYLTSQWRSQHGWQQLSMKGQQHQWPATAGRTLMWERRSLGEFSLWPYGTVHRQPRAAHTFSRWHHCRLPRRRQCWWMEGGNRKGSWKKKQAKHWSIAQRRWVPKCRVPASMRAAVAALLRPMNLCGWRAPGMRAPRNTTQFIMHQVYQDMRRQEKEAAANKGVAVPTILGEKPVMQYHKGNNICNLVAENLSHMVTFSAMSPERCISDGEGKEKK